MRLYLNAKEVSALIRAIELLISREPQCMEAETLLARIYDCQERQGYKAKKNRQIS